MTYFFSINLCSVHNTIFLDEQQDGVCKIIYPTPFTKQNAKLASFYNISCRHDFHFIINIIFSIKQSKSLKYENYL